MAVIWQKHSKDKLYEVRAAGQTCRLYTNGVFHSQYNPNNELTANVWDMLSLPSFFLTEDKIRNILVLGVGGGAIVKQFNKWYPQAHVVGVELDAVHIQVAKRFFNVNKKSCDLVQADAIEWLKSYRGVKFDLVIEDMFSEDDDGEPQRVAQANSRWFKHLDRVLSPHAILVLNFTEAKDFRGCAYCNEQDIKRRFKSAFRLSTPLYENTIAAFTKKKTTLKEFKDNLRKKENVYREYLANIDKYNIKKIS